MTAIWWVRRDLRLADNQALGAALSYAKDVIPLFILDPALLNSSYCGSKRITFLFGGLRELDEDLRQLGSSLVVRQGQPARVLADLVSESGAAAVFAEEDISPYARHRDSEVAKRVPLHLTGGLTVYPPDLVLKQDGRPYTVFTPFSKKWKALPAPEAVDLRPSPTRISTPALPSLPIPDDPPLAQPLSFMPGESEGLRRLNDFAVGAGAAVYGYNKQRNRPDIDGTSSLSPYLRFGMVSMRRAVDAARQAMEMAADENGRESAATWLNELIWREFFLSILYHFPHVRERSFRSQYDSVRWENDRQAFESWCQGRTGYPIVDAAMRQLLESGWMHNRTRMIVASFLVKDLLIDWRWGERWFMQHLIDGDPAANNGGWQWSAGTGTDAAPYFRVFNPILQSKKFDPFGRYIRRWLPELAEVPQKYIHEPWKMTADVQKGANCLLGQDYPLPIVDHAAARKRALAAYKQAAA